MTDIATTLRECHKIVWDARAEMEAYWPTPTTEDALLFAFTELGEAVDAYLRTKPEYARNNAKDLDVLDELADVVLMLVTAFGQHRRVIVLNEEGINRFVECEGRGWRDLISEMGSTLFWFGDPEAGAIWVETAVIMIERISTYPEMDLPTRLTSRLERIKAKQMAKVVTNGYSGQQ